MPILSHFSYSLNRPPPRSLDFGARLAALTPLRSLLPFNDYFQSPSQITY